MFASKKSDRTIPWGILMIEAVLVILSVILALGLNSWRESRQHRDLANRALNGLTEEYSTNCGLISRIQPYHNEVASGDRPSEGLQVGLIRNDAWDSAQSTGAAAHIDFQTASIIGQIFALQRDHRTLFQSYIDAIFQKAGNQNSLDKLHGDLDVIAIRELTRIQEKLLQLFNEYGVMIKEANKDQDLLEFTCS